MKHIYTLSLVSLCWAGCSVIKPAPQTVPTYVHIDSFHFLQPPGYYAVDGSTSHDIGTAFVFYNNQAVGVFDLPCTIPVIANDSGVLEVEPGVSVNGIEDNQVAYPFYTIDTFQFHASGGTVLNHTASTEYTSAARLAFNVDFEQGNGFTLISGDSAIQQINRQNHPASMIYEGDGSGYINLGAPGDSSIISSQQGFTVPQANGVGTPFIELNYQSTVPFYVGLIAISTATGDTVTTPPYYLAGIYPSNSWKKFYVKLADFVEAYPAEKYLILIKATLPSNQSNGYLLLDNIKVITNPN